MLQSSLCNILVSIPTSIWIETVTKSSKGKQEVDLSKWAIIATHIAAHYFVQHIKYDKGILAEAIKEKRKNLASSFASRYGRNWPKEDPEEVKREELGEEDEQIKVLLTDKSSSNHYWTESIRAKSMSEKGCMKT